MRYPALVLVTLLLFASSVQAQDAQRATVFASLNMTALQPGQQAALAVVLDVNPGFHAHSNTPKGEGNIATQVAVNDTPSFTTYAPIYPPGKDMFYPALGQLNVYSGRAIIYVP